MVNVPLCLKHKVPYNYTSFPNFFNDISQRDAASVSTTILIMFFDNWQRFFSDVWKFEKMQMSRVTLNLNRLSSLKTSEQL